MCENVGIVLQAVSAASRTVRPCRPCVCSVITPSGKLLIALEVIVTLSISIPDGTLQQKGAVCVCVCEYVSDTLHTNGYSFQSNRNVDDRCLCRLSCVNLGFSCKP